MGQWGAPAAPGLQAGPAAGRCSLLPCRGMEERGRALGPGGSPAPAWDEALAAQLTLLLPFAPSRSLVGCCFCRGKAPPLLSSHHSTAQHPTIPWVLVGPRYGETPSLSPSCSPFLTQRGLGGVFTPTLKVPLTSSMPHVAGQDTDNQPKVPPNATKAGHIQPFPQDGLLWQHHWPGSTFIEGYLSPESPCPKVPRPEGHLLKAHLLEGHPLAGHLLEGHPRTPSPRPLAVPGQLLQLPTETPTQAPATTTAETGAKTLAHPWLTM